MDSEIHYYIITLILQSLITMRNELVLADPKYELTYSHC